MDQKPIMENWHNFQQICLTVVQSQQFWAYQQVIHQME